MLVDGSCAGLKGNDGVFEIRVLERSLRRNVRIAFDRDVGLIAVVAVRNQLLLFECQRRQRTSRLRLWSEEFPD